MKRTIYNYKGTVRGLREELMLPAIGSWEEVKKSFEDLEASVRELERLVNEPTDIFGLMGLTKRNIKSPYFQHGTDN